MLSLRTVTVASAGPYPGFLTHNSRDGCGLAETAPRMGSPGDNFRNRFPDHPLRLAPFLEVVVGRNLRGPVTGVPVPQACPQWAGSGSQKAGCRRQIGEGPAEKEACRHSHAVNVRDEALQEKRF